MSNVVTWNDWYGQLTARPLFGGTQSFQIGADFVPMLHIERPPPA